jgi:hypothetical protein
MNPPGHLSSATGGVVRTAGPPLRPGGSLRGEGHGRRVSDATIPRSTGAVNSVSLAAESTIDAVPRRLAEV